MHHSQICLFFFFKQKTAYEMRISDWSSDVCSSDLARIASALSKSIDAAQTPDAGIVARLPMHLSRVRFRNNECEGTLVDSLANEDQRRCVGSKRPGREIEQVEPGCQPALGRAADVASDHHRNVAAHAGAPEPAHDRSAKR